MQRASVTLVAAGIAVLGVISACGGTADSGGASGMSTSGYRVALLTPGPISDQAWNAGAYAGLMRIQDSLAAQTSHIQVKTPADFEENFRQYGAAGYTLVFGHGFEFQDAAARVAPDYPRTTFVTTGGETVRPNVAALSFAFDEPSFLAGMAAAAASRSGTIACVGGTELPPVKSSFEAFAAGARAVKPDVRVIVTYIGNWDDMTAGKEQALALKRRGVDVVFQNADAAGLGVFQAAKEQSGLLIIGSNSNQNADAAGLGVFQAAKELSGLLVIGSNSNQNAVAPEVTLGSVVIDLPHAFLLVAKEVKSGGFVPRVIRLTTRDDVVRWVPGEILATHASAAVLQRVDSVQSTMRTGTFTLPAATKP